MRAILLVLLSVVFGLTCASADDDMVFVEGGCFMMGSDYGERNARPAHEVCLDDYYIDKYEVTQGAYERVMKKNPSRFKGSTLPVNAIDREDAVSYCTKVGKRLPTEAEWEYAARSRGKETRWSGTDKYAAVEEYGWFRTNAGAGPHPVGGKMPNDLGIYDMSGNVWEWVQDKYERDYYRRSPKMNPKGPVTLKAPPNTSSFLSGEAEQGPHNAIYFVYRGGAFTEKYDRLTIYYRNGRVNASTSIGFRCARSAQE